VAGAVTGAHAVVLMLFGAQANREVLTQVVGGATKGALIIDSTTSGPDAAREFGEQCAAAGLRYLDAPVAGTVGPARDGTLGILVGGADADFAAAQPLLTLWGALPRFATSARWERATPPSWCSTWASVWPWRGSWTLGQKRQMLIARDASPTSFSLDLLAKDLDLAVNAGHRPLPVTASALELTREAANHGHGEQDYAALGVHLIEAAGDWRERRILGWTW